MLFAIKSYLDFIISMLFRLPFYLVRLAILLTCYISSFYSLIHFVLYILRDALWHVMIKLNFADPQFGRLLSSGLDGSFYIYLAYSASYASIVCRAALCLASYAKTFQYLVSYQNCIYVHLSQHCTFNILRFWDGFPTFKCVFFFF